MKKYEISTWQPLGVAAIAVGMSLSWPVAARPADGPRSLDERLTVELFAEHPQIMTPTGLAVDRQGRVFVAESHTHFRPKDYDGPPADRILIFADTDGDGRADTRSIFHEGFTHVMDIEFHHDGSLYVATRMDIHRLRDTNGDGRADEITPIVRMETRGNYPHNGLSGIAFDLQGGFHFGLGENLGEAYTLIGADGTRLSGGGEGGSTYWVDDQGNKLRRISTGWWNPYGMCLDSFGRLFGTDNDPDASPPCRLIQVVPDGDYGYEFRYGRSGRNPLTSWEGELPGTLPMIAGTGEAPCHVVSYESDALPEAYFGHLLVPSWADHRIEHFRLEQETGRGFATTRRQTLIEGPDDFRPVGIDVAPDGSIYVSDWVSSSYNLHKLGRIWRIRPKQLPVAIRPTAPAAALRHRDRRVRETAARNLAGTVEGRNQLEQVVQESALPQARATALQVLASAGGTKLAPVIVQGEGEPTELRALAARVAASQNRGDTSWRNERLPTPVRVELLQAVDRAAPAELADSLQSRDPLLRHAAVGALARTLSAPDYAQRSLPDGLPEPSALLAVRRSQSANRTRAQEQLEKYLRSRDPQVRVAAVKWVADEQLKSFGPRLEELLASPDLDLGTFLAIQVALQRLSGQAPSDRPPPARLLERILADDTPLIIRRIALRLIDPTFAKLRVDDLSKLLSHPDAALRKEALRSLAQHAESRRFELLAALARDAKQPEEMRAIAVGGLAAGAAAQRDTLVELALTSGGSIREEALRSLMGVDLTEEQRQTIRNLADSPSMAEAVRRIVEKSPPARPSATDIDAWMALLPASGNASSGERIFFGEKVGTCAKCHQADGRGAAVGPDLSRISARMSIPNEDGRRWLLATILQPSRDMAPQFAPWMIVTKDGRQHVGLPRRKGGNSEAYLGADGKEFTLRKSDIESYHETNISIMPAELLQQLTRQELADLIAFLSQR